MTVRQIIELAGSHPVLFSAILLAAPTLSWVLAFLHGKGRGALSPWKYIYATMVYMACLPGVLSAVLLGYTLFFTRESLLDVNLLVYILPIVSMTVTLALISRSVSFDDIPGFDRLSGLILVITITFILALGIQKTRIWLFFGGSYLALLILLGALFLLLNVGFSKLFRSRRRPLKRPPS